MSVSTDKNFDEKLLKLQSWLNELYGDVKLYLMKAQLLQAFLMKLLSST
ncbi:MAG: hypothetical protein Ct9H90mP6_09950 [Gammaproteobacteria bacterium]|nr:MAG: hypothetical protein Ct9H90mP6_09950 [Gammaproteobacteria bacterium]